MHVLLSINVTGSDKRVKFCTFSEFSFLNVYNSKTIAAMDLNFGKIILSSSYYIRKEFRAPLISSVGGASVCVDHI